jgi:anaerobic selenocysteine-containing dehydrogenase
VCIATGTDRGFTFHISRFCNAFGTPNWIAPGGAQCFVPAMAGDIWTYGEPAFVPHYEGCPECMVLWGSQATVTNPSAFGGMIMWNKARGAKLVVIDPRFSREASKSDLWLQIRPGTDTALALAWLNVIINEKLNGQLVSAS